LFEALRSLPGTIELHLFGSLATGTADGYSDIDLQVLTRDLDASQKALLPVLEGVGPISLNLETHETERGYLSTVLFLQESCYHKLDVGLSETAGVDASPPLFLGPSRMIWRMGSPAPQLEDRPVRAYTPAEGTPAHFVVGLLLAGIRYVKARKRGKHWTCWRFLSAQMDWQAMLLYEKAHDWTPLRRKLNTLEYAELDALPSPEVRNILFTYTDLSSPPSMDVAYCRLLAQMLEMSHANALHAGYEMPAICLERLMSFIRSELAQ